MLWWLLLILAIAFGCSFLAPDSGLTKSALETLESSVCMLSRAGVEQSATPLGRQRTECVDDEPGIVGASDEGTLRSSISASTPPLRSVRTAPRPMPPLMTSNIRKGVAPLMQKHRAAFNFKCALCRLPFTDASLREVDHIVPLSYARAAADVERLNNIENLAPVHRGCHQLKSSRETSAR